MDINIQKLYVSRIMNRIIKKFERKNDWCHLCGQRGLLTFSEFTVPENAEHSQDDAGRGYFRVCEDCIRNMAMNIQENIDQHFGEKKSAKRAFLAGTPHEEFDEDDAS